MTYRRKYRRVSLLDELVHAPWQASVVIGVFVLVGLKWLLPNVAANNVLLKPLAQALSGIAWLFSGLFFLIGALVFVKQVVSRSEQSGRSIRGFSADKEPALAGRVPMGAGADFPARKEPLDLYDTWTKSTSAERAKPTAWSLEVLREIEWKRFEDVCQKYFEMLGIRSETTKLGADGGIDIRLYRDDSEKPASIVQCKAWGTRPVGVKLVRELLGVMTHEKVDEAIFMTSSCFSQDAEDVARSNRITLIDGERLLAMIKQLAAEDQQRLLEFATEGDYRTPTCPGCGTKMTHVSGSVGRPDFWGCQHYPRCRRTLPMKREA